MTDDVIARRVFKIDGQPTECRFYRPEEDAGSFFCKVQIDWPEGARSKRAGGVDEVQALLLGMMLAHSELLAARNMDCRAISWLDDQSLGLPVTPGLRDWDPDNRL
ncbi:hypothetical protein ABIC65_001016 [Sphingomonas trueperi]|uniref:DUF6968 family protein n=1 Tax=Sphingomonas trueperi TaxID=53317 RepID=UPI003392874C